MIKKKYVKRLYIEEAYCEKCGAKLEYTGMAYLSFPAQYKYICSNKECDYTINFNQDNKPGTLRFEYEEDTNV